MFKTTLILLFNLVLFNIANATSLDIQISSGEDDAEEQISRGNVNIGKSDLGMGVVKRKSLITGMRFNNININKNTQIINAYIQFTVQKKSSELTTLTIKSEATDHALPFISTKFNLSERSFTAINTQWSPAPWDRDGASGIDQRTLDLSPIIQEIINRSGWSAGNSIALLVEGSGLRTAVSFDGAQASAPVLHIEFDGALANQIPFVDAGVDMTKNLPIDSVLLDATVTDDGLPSGTLTTTWSHVGGTGAGVVSFNNPNAVDTTATFTHDTGTYILRLTANDGELSSFDEMTLFVNDSGQAGGAVESISQLTFTLTGYDNDGNQLPVPSIDPAGIVYHEPSGNLIIADSEINEVTEVFSEIQANIFEVPLIVDSVIDQVNLTLITGNEPAKNKEPTGITYCGNHFYVTNDDNDLVYRYQYDGSNFTTVDSVSTRPNSTDPEGITCDPLTGRLYVIGGTGIIIQVYSYNSGFVLEEELNLVTTAGTPNGIPSDPEGIAFDPISGNLFVISDPDEAIFEYTTNGVFVTKYDISTFSPSPINPQGLTIGPSSDGSSSESFYISDARVDNDYDPNERDGIIYEALIQRAP